MAYRDVVLADNPVFYNPMDSTSVNDTDIGSSGGTWSVNGATKVLSGIEGTRCMNWNGTGRGNSDATKPFTPGNAGVTVECWIKTTDAAATIMQVTSGSGTNLPGHLRVYLSSGAVYFQRMSDTSLWYGNPDVTVNDDEWHHIVAVYRRNTGDTLSGYVNIYIDGVEVLNAYIGTQSASNSSFFYIGGDRWLTSGLLGLQDEAALYSYALSPTRVAAHWDAGKPIVEPPAETPFRGWGIRLK